MLFAHKKTKAVITQTIMGADGKTPGQLTADDVASLDAREGVLFGRNRKGLTILILPLAEVAMATIEEKA